MLAKAELGVGDRIELLRALFYHSHAGEEERSKMEASQKYMAQVGGGGRLAAQGSRHSGAWALRQPCAHVLRVNLPLPVTACPPGPARARSDPGLPAPPE